MTEPETPAAPPVPTLPAVRPGGSYPAFGPPHIPMQPGPPYPAYPPRPIPVAPNGEPLADAGTRFLAYFIDSLIIAVANLVPVAAIITLMFDRFHQAIHGLLPVHGQVTDTTPAVLHLLRLELIVIAVALPVTLLFSYLYHVEFSYRNGQTVGKKIMNIKVVRTAADEPMTRRTMQRRWLVFHVASLVAPYFSYVDCLWLLWDKPFQQCLHDKCADTVVVKSRP